MEEERRAMFCSELSESMEKKREPLRRIGRGINTPCLPTIT
jgi:hypothetical protein